MAYNIKSDPDLYNAWHAITSGGSIKLHKNGEATRQDAWGMPVLMLACEVRSLLRTGYFQVEGNQMVLTEEGRKLWRTR